MTISPIQGTDGKLPDSYDQDPSGSYLSPLYVYQYGIRDENWEYIVEPKWDGTPIDIIVEEGITEIPAATFINCDINSLTLPESLISGTFERIFCCDILEIPANTIYIGGFAESDFKHIIIGENVQELGNYIFDHCLNLETVTFLSKTPPSVGSFALWSPLNFEIYVPEESVELYKNHPDWQYVVNIIKPIPQTSGPTAAPTAGPTAAPYI